MIINLKRKLKWWPPGPESGGNKSWFYILDDTQRNPAPETNYTIEQFKATKGRFVEYKFDVIFFFKMFRLCLLAQMQIFKMVVVVTLFSNTMHKQNTYNTTES